MKNVAGQLEIPFVFGAPASDRRSVPPLPPPSAGYARVTLPAEAARAAADAVRAVLANARGTYAPHSQALSTGWVDFSPAQARTVLQALDAADAAGTGTVDVNPGQAEAVVKILRSGLQKTRPWSWSPGSDGRWRLRFGGKSDPGWRKVALAARKPFERALAELTHAAQEAPDTTPVTAADSAVEQAA